MERQKKKIQYIKIKKNMKIFAYNGNNYLRFLDKHLGSFIRPLFSFAPVCLRSHVASLESISHTAGCCDETIVSNQRTKFKTNKIVNKINSSIAIKWCHADFWLFYGIIILSNRMWIFVRLSHKFQMIKITRSTWPHCNAMPSFLYFNFVFI